MVIFKWCHFCNTISLLLIYGMILYICWITITILHIAPTSPRSAAFWFHFIVHNLFSNFQYFFVGPLPNDKLIRNFKVLLLFEFILFLQICLVILNIHLKGQFRKKCFFDISRLCCLLIPFHSSDFFWRFWILF
jgi:hypothetical protein